MNIATFVANDKLEKLLICLVFLVDGLVYIVHAQFTLKAGNLCQKLCIQSFFLPESQGRNYNLGQKFVDQPDILLNNLP